ncbi:hypothetical protein AAG747_08905 [Rapidithrix thailandica]|uniref:Uncharacterized protein n=1 Tax=Rapidithrix thailandica TaxID=413964 RepID=A0AAW9RWH4_9BACT
MRLKLIFGILFLGFGVILYLIGKPALHTEYAHLQEATALDTAKPAEGQRVWVEGKVSADNPLLVKDFVVANKEDYTGTGKLNGWKVVQEYLQEIKVVTPSNTLQVVFSEVPTRGTEQTVVSTEARTEKGRHIRYRGVTAQSTVTFIGEVQKVAPLKVKAEHVYVGKLSDYQKMLDEGNELINYICGGLALIGLLLALWHFASRRP